MALIYKDSLRSIEYANILDAVSEGEIEGLVNGKESIFINDTPLQNPDGSFNFQNTTTAWRNGTQAQTVIPGFLEVGAETDVAVKVTNDIPVTISITNSLIDIAKVTVSTKGFYRTNKNNGDSVGISVDYEIQLQSNGGGFSTVRSLTLNGKTTSLYQKSERIELTGDAPWDIKVVRVTEDRSADDYSSKNVFVDEIYFDSYTEIIDDKLSYPNTALVGISIDAEQFASIPSRAYEIKGLKVNYPSNYDPETRVYTGVWDGTFSFGWTNNPAWCFYDMVTSPRYGLGEFVSADQVDKWTLYTIAQYCDELVDDGFGGTEPRFACNLYLQKQEDALKVIRTMASIFRAFTYWGGNEVAVSQDAPSDAVAIYSRANVIDGKFEYTTSSGRTRHTVALVTWNDPADAYLQKVEYVEDADGIARYGYLPTDLVAFGCTSRGQAHRVGKWLLYTENYEYEVVALSTGLDSAFASPGEVIQITDTNRAGDRVGGRVTSVTVSGTQVNIDSAVTIQPATDYTLYCKIPDGSVESRSLVDLGSPVPVEVESLTVTSAFTEDPQAASMWLLATDNLEPEYWRVLSVTEDSALKYNITAAAYRSDKYDFVENGIALGPLSTTTLRDVPDQPTDITVSEELYLVTKAVVGTRMTVGATSSAERLRFEYKEVDSNWVSRETTQRSVDFNEIVAGTYDIRVTAINALGRVSAPVITRLAIYGLSLKPADVANFQLAAISGGAHLTWSVAEDLDVLVGGYMRIRHTPDLVSPSWSSSIDIGPRLAGTSTSGVLPLLTGSYLAKWVDSTGNSSADPVIISRTVADISDLVIYDTITESPAFAGTGSGFAVEGGVLKLDTVTLDETGPVDTWYSIDLFGERADSATYYFANGSDLGSVQLVRLYANITASGVADIDTLNLRGPLDEWPDLDGLLVDDVEAQLYVRTTNDDPTGSPTWSDWQQFFVGEYNARAFEFRLDILGGFDTHNLLVSALSVDIGFPARGESADDVTSGAVKQTVTYGTPFIEQVSVGITAQDMQTGDYYELTNKGLASFDIEFKNSGGTTVSRTFDWAVRGY